MRALESVNVRTCERVRSGGTTRERARLRHLRLCDLILLSDGAKHSFHSLLEVLLQLIHRLLEAARRRIAAAGRGQGQGGGLGTLRGRASGSRRDAAAVAVRAPHPCLLVLDMNHLARLHNFSMSS